MKVSSTVWLGLMKNWERKKEPLVKLDQTIKLSPYDPKAHFSLGRIKHDLGDSDGAIDSLKKATHLDPDFGDAYYRLGLAYDSQNQSYDSISSLMIAEIVYHKARKTDFLEKTRTEMKTLFEKYQVQRSDFRDLQVPETLKGYDLHQRPNQIGTSKQK
jgi:tetratricopeptide (TPR) repeat protein